MRQLNNVESALLLLGGLLMVVGFVIRRLRRILIISDVLFLVAALLMFANEGNFLGIQYLSYIKYVHNNWIVVLLVAAILQLYASHRIANELEKDAKNAK